MPPGQTRRYGVSGALLAQENGRLIVPVAHNAGYYWPRRGLMKKPGTIRVVIGQPISPAGREVREVNEEIQALDRGDRALPRPGGEGLLASRSWINEDISVHHCLCNALITLGLASDDTLERVEGPHLRCRGSSPTARSSR